MHIEVWQHPMDVDQAALTRRCSSEHSKDRSGFDSSSVARPDTRIKLGSRDGHIMVDVDKGC